ncbi:uncharacterized protein LOC130747451 [Lotus japonicus]|uniref:uncharacterized protein LOC130747451 n=1 Tax=Lotus japonicus TaxID=34305 RepID=UPI00258A50F0|nr:uncharacterized protein LOC130747451 [Lotus japonicus]
MAKKNNNGQLEASGSNHGVLDPSLDPLSLYFVHPGDGPLTVSVSPKLTSANYQMWTRSMRRALSAKNKFRFVDGSIPVPEADHPLYFAWERCNNLIHTWIMNSVSSSIAQNLVYIENVIDVWNELKERFSQVDLIRISELQSEISNLRQGSSTITDFFTELKTLWEEIDGFRPLPICICNARCPCQGNAKIYKDQDYIIRFLTGLNEEFATVRSQILLMKPLPTLNEVFSMVIQQKRQSGASLGNSGQNVGDARSMLNAVDNRQGYGRGRGYPQGNQYSFSSAANANKNRGYYSGSGSGSGRGTRICSHCGRIGHTIDSCYKIYGLPPSFRSQNNGSVNNFQTEEGNNGDHLYCNEDPQQPEVPVSQSSHVLNGNNSHTTTTTFVPAPTFTTEQYQKLLNLIQGTADTQSVSSSHINQLRIHEGPHQINQIHPHHGTTSKGKCTTIVLSYYPPPLPKACSEWILDSGATVHVCSRLELFHTFFKINPMSVQLPNGNTVKAQLAGTVIFTPLLSLINVLYVPDFSFNIISTSKLCEHLSCVVLSYSTHSLIQDLNS